MRSRVCVVWCPDWSITAAVCDDDTPASHGTPMMIVHGGKVASCSVEAKSEGVRVGQRLREAQASCPDIIRVPFSPERDQRIFDRLLSSLSDVVALAGVIEPGMIHLGASGLARYYGSEEEAARVVLRAIAAFGVRTPIAVGYADTLFAATQAARLALHTPTTVLCVAPGGDRAFLADLPVECLDDRDMAALCAPLGIHTLGQFADLPGDQVAERFGDRGRLLHDVASGRDPRHVVVADIPPGSEVVWRSDEPCESGEQLAFLVASSAQRFISQLLAARFVVQAVDVTLVDDRGQHHRTLWSHPRYFTATELVHRVRWQGESLASSQADTEYGGGIIEVRFVASRPTSAAGYEESLWGNAHRSAALSHTVATLQGTLGHRAVAGVHLHLGHDLGDTQQRLPWGDHRVDQNSDRVDYWAGQLPAPHPATVFSQPLPVSVTDEAGHPVDTLPVGAGLTAAPHWLVARGNRRRVTAWAGPWPVMERWWEAQHSRFIHRVQLLDDTGVGWLVKTSEGEAGWVVEARYD
jgi:protein ImuB